MCLSFSSEHEWCSNFRKFFFLPFLFCFFIFFSSSPHKEYDSEFRASLRYCQPSTGPDIWRWLKKSIVKWNRSEFRFALWSPDKAFLSISNITRKKKWHVNTWTHNAIVRRITSFEERKRKSEIYETKTIGAVKKRISCWCESPRGKNVTKLLMLLILMSFSSVPHPPFRIWTSMLSDLIVTKRSQLSCTYIRLRCTPTPSWYGGGTLISITIFRSKSDEINCTSVALSLCSEFEPIIKP